MYYLEMGSVRKCAFYTRLPKKPDIQGVSVHVPAKFLLPIPFYEV